MTNRNAAQLHRRLDRGQAEAMARDGGELVDHAGALMRPRDRKGDMRTMTNGRPAREPRVLLLKLSERVSEKGTEYMTGWCGCARVVAFRAEEPDRDGRPQWNVYVAEPQPKSEERGRGSARYATGEGAGPS